MEQLFFVVYFPCYGARGYRVFEVGAEYSHSMGDALEGVYYSRESAQKMADYLSDLHEAAYQSWEYAEAMEDAYPCPFEDWGYRE